MQGRKAFVAVAAVVLATGCSVGSPVGAPAPSDTMPETIPSTGTHPELGWELGETLDLVWAVRHEKRKIGVIGVGHTNDDLAGIDAVFEPRTTLAAASKSVGVSHFNWYQFLVKDTDPPKDASGQRLQAPFIDPPCGGYGGLDRDWADQLPWYWDEAEPPGPGGGHADRGNQLDVNLEDGSLFHSDAPDGAPGTKLVFRTYLTGVAEQGSAPVFLGGWSWSFTIDEYRGRVSAVKRLAEDEPQQADFDAILADSSCPS
jgi:hypothetical protein